jgi:Tfp pilus assembly protein PilO
MAKAKPKPQSGSQFFSKIAKLKKGQKMGILIAGLAVVLVGFYLLYYQPYDDELAGLKSEVDGLNSSISTEEGNIKRHTPIKEYIQPVAHSFEYLQHFLTTENEIPRLMQIISDQGSEAGARVTLFAPKLATLQPDYAEIGFTMNLEGSFLNILKFFYSLSQMERIINIKSVSLDNPTLGDNFLMILSVRCEGSTYRLLTPDEAKMVESGKK